MRDLRTVSSHKSIVRPKRFFKRNQGLTLIEVGVSLVVMSAAIIGAVVVINQYTEDTKINVVAQQIDTFASASRNYIRDSSGTIFTTATATDPFLINADLLIAAGYLPAGYVGVNGYQQGMCTLVLLDGVRLNALTITEGGLPLKDGALAKMASFLGGSGGAIYSEDPNRVVGVSAAFSFDITPFRNPNNEGLNCLGNAGAPVLTAGTAAKALWFESEMDGSDGFLHRNAIPGRPELNTMNTALNMGGNSVVNVGGISFQTSPAVINSGDSCTGRDNEFIMTSDYSLMACQDIDPDPAVFEWQWQPVGGGSVFWRDPVDAVANLPACGVGQFGHAALVRGPINTGFPVVYACNGAQWRAASIDADGNLSIRGNLDVAGISSFNGATIFNNGATFNNQGITVNNADIDILNGDIIVTDGSLDISNGVFRSNDGVISDVTIEGNEALMSRAVFDARVINSGDVVQKPVCPATASPQIFVSADSFPVGTDMVVQTEGGSNVTGSILRFRTSGPGAVVDQGGSWRVFGEAFVRPPLAADGTQPLGAWYRLAGGDATLSVSVKCT